MRGAGWGSRNPVSSLENLHINRYTNPAITSVIISNNTLEYPVKAYCIMISTIRDQGWLVAIFLFEGVNLKIIGVSALRTIISGSIITPYISI